MTLTWHTCGFVFKLNVWVSTRTKAFSIREARFVCWTDGVSERSSSLIQSDREKRAAVEIWSFHCSQPDVSRLTCLSYARLAARCMKTWLFPSEAALFEWPTVAEGKIRRNIVYLKWCVSTMLSAHHRKLLLFSAWVLVIIEIQYLWEYVNSGLNA